MDLSAYAEPLAHDIAFDLVEYHEDDYPIDRMGDVCLRLVEKLAAVGIVLLTCDGDSIGYQHNLIRAGRVRLRYLRRLEGVGVAQRHQASGRYAGVAAAVAAGDFDLARAIAAISPAGFRPDDEREDDYCSAQLVHAFVAKEWDSPRVAGLLRRYRAFLGRDTDPRWRVFSAIAEADHAAFDGAFEALLAAREASFAAADRRGRLVDHVVYAHRQVYVCGIALLGLAELRGLRTSPEYRMCPALARAPLEVPCPSLAGG